MREAAAVVLAAMPVVATALVARGNALLLRCIATDCVPELVVFTLGKPQTG